MKKIQQELFHRTQTTKDFVFYKTDEKISHDLSNTLSTESIQAEFCDMLSGKDFLEFANKAIKKDNYFGVAAIKLDEDPKTREHPSREKQMMVLTHIDNLCKFEKGIWGQLEPFSFVCFFPQKTSDETLSVCENFQKQFSDTSEQTLTTGIASFPTLDYKKNKIVECALKALDHAEFFGPNSRVVFDAVSLNISGDHFYQKGRIDEAVKEYKDALKIDSKDVNVLNSMGVCYAVMGDFNTALKYFKLAGKYGPDEVMAWYNSALVQKLKGDKEKALKNFLKAHAMKQDSFEIAFQTGKIYFETGDQNTGKKYYQTALKLSENIEGNSRFVGDCHTGLGDMAKALKAYQTAVKENPNDAHALSSLGSLYDLKGENPEIALVFCQQSIDISPQNSLFRRRLALLYLKQEKWDKALDAFKTADQLDIDLARPKKKKKNSGENTSKNKPPVDTKSDMIKSVA